MVLQIAMAFLWQVLFTVGAVIVFGCVIALLNRLFYRNFGSHYLTAAYITGFIGTPVHELSHALLCLVFCHKITEIKLFQINDEDGTLGYVNHSYNRRNIYQRIGNFFIGIAPLIVISAILYVIAMLLLPQMTSAMTAELKGLQSYTDAGSVFAGLWQAVIVFFSYIAAWQWWVFLLAGILLCLHMTLSRADVRGALSGILLTLIALLIADIVLWCAGANYLASFTGAVLSAAGYLICFFVLSLLLSLIAVALSFVLRFTVLRNA